MDSPSNRERDSIEAAIAALRAYPALQAEVERLKKGTTAECDYRAKWGMCEGLDERYELAARAEKAEAELKKWKPLIEAAGKVDKGNAIFFLTDMIERQGYSYQDPVPVIAQIRALLAALPDKEPK
jgi:hypothetical protein